MPFVSALIKAYACCVVDEQSAGESTLSMSVPSCTVDFEACKILIDTVSGPRTVTEGRFDDCSWARREFVYESKLNAL
jgi:hypothetical protein